MENSHKFIKLLLAIVAVLILAFVLYKFVGNNRQSSELKTPETAVVKKMDVDFSKLPEKFPTNIPIESGAKITQNYNATTPEGEFQATRSFVTTKTLAENIKIYSNILDKDGWKSKVVVDDPNFKMISGSKDKKQITISVDDNKTTNIKTVTISYIETLK